MQARWNAVEASILVGLMWVAVRQLLPHALALIA
jgi:hypothetical protein